MRLLSIETSCDETAISLIETTDQKGLLRSFRVLADITHSQVDVHKEYGGVFPALAKREHAKNLVLIARKILERAGFSHPKKEPSATEKKEEALRKLLEREQGLCEQFLAYIPTIEKPPIDAIAVTEGPGLEPALWVGISFAKALSLYWDIPLVGENHMEGHIFSALISRDESAKSEARNPKHMHDAHIEENSKQFEYRISDFEFPALSLLVSGGHTELILMKDWGVYECIGKTRDDAVGEAFDKVARILGLPYPGGPEISALATKARSAQTRSHNKVVLPRPMMYSGDLDFSFSGLKTAVLYLVKEKGTVSEEDALLIAEAFEDAAIDVLCAKTAQAIATYAPQTILLGGGVVANAHLRDSFARLAKKEGVTLLLPPREVTTDNALMIAVAALHRLMRQELIHRDIVAKGNLVIGR